MNWQGFRLDVVQTAVFLRSQEFSPASAVAAILPEYGDRFDGEMQALPLPGDVPPEIPRVILQSADARWRLSMAPARIDSTWSNKPGPVVPSVLADTAEQCAQVLNHYVAKKRIRIARLALVVQRVCPAENPADALIHRFCNDESRREPFNRSETFEIHNHKVYTPQNGWSINSWVRCKSAKLLADNTPVVLVEQDLNTVVDESDPNRFDAGQLDDFFQMAVVEADEILSKYFPRKE